MAAVLRAGGVVVLPTDTVVGLAASPADAAAMARIATLKGRPPEQACAVLVADVDQGLALLEGPPAAARAWADRWWPGPLTLVGRRSAVAADYALGGDPTTIGVRCPADPLVREVAALAGPIAATSANRHGAPTAATPAAAAADLTGPVDLVVPAAPGAGDAPSGVASTVVDVTVEPWVVLREGDVSGEDLARAGGAGS